ncbi:MAG: tRNA uridine-5-carboxymethylaminomethyl(34) synthesis GTPase MnmE [Candidatus Syntrophonatronum acetioxidans]|uniref:tRNA modification GTPase MnmE n=1 Tax=Candidatus Syntrophonatronum acetioxidans TaxID=1795816 RepID=A0A424YBT0_9FIRM|nr:MAG: tRNA uridine-5-carboxymethylaminomethyl(34) synthesis GTPase MnmE [Candidatus Syntrophonatronum acetioxidans]
MEEDTIAAISTPLGEGGIGIVRLSGKDAFSLARKIFKGKGNKIEYRKLLYGHIIDPQDKRVIDEVLVSFMPAPYTYTREDVVEINCHGGIVPLKRILEICLEQGARLAERGEFTLRAFLKGRIDLSQAEGVIDLIRAKTDEGRELALSQVEGKLSQKIKEIKEKILDILAFVEVNLDYPEEDVEEITGERVKEEVKTIIEEIEEILEGAEEGKIYREGIKTAIIGKPNVGKSSLLNALLREQRAIVTEVPGTTRDLLEEAVNIKGVPLNIIDTAGIRKTEDLVEKLGVERTEKILKESHLIIFILDAHTSLEKEDKNILKILQNKKFLVFINKIDLVTSREVDKIVEELGDLPVIKASVKYGEGLKELEKMILDLVFEGKIVSPQSVMVSNTRHKASLEKGKKSLEEALQALEEGLPLDLVAIDLKGSWEALGEITGETIDEGILNKIFSQFCIGK